ncbi:MAG: FtsX-like permease family protein [bacterium]|nr:FtsX-like permease family protein [bacterium]
MLKNYFKTAFRNLLRTKMFSFINVLGLSIGMTAFLLILHYVSFQKSYDGFHENSDRIYRLRYERTSAEGSIVKFASCCPPAAPLVAQRYPEVEKIARIFRYRGVISFEDKKFLEEGMYYAEPDFFDILKFKFISGDPLTGIKDANNAFISQSAAKKYFPGQDPMGKTFQLNKRDSFQVSGVFEDLPDNSHIKFDIVLSFPNIHRLYNNQRIQSWGETGFYTYLRLKPNTSARAFEQKLVKMIEDAAGELQKAYDVKIHLKMQPLEDIHLTSHFMQEYEVNGDRDSVNFLFIIALFIIIMAWVNYVNLSTARSLTRAKEVGLRKVVGASRNQLMVQFFCEIVLINFAAILISFLLVKLSLPFFNNITNTPLSYSIWTASWFWTAVPIMFLMGIILSGLYPVAVMSSFQPVSVLKGKLGHTVKGMNLRKYLVVFQFLMAFVLITGTLAVDRQLTYMRNQELGFDIDQVLVIKSPRVRESNFGDSIDAFRDELLRNPKIINFCAVSQPPGRQIIFDAGGIRRAGEAASKGKNYQIVTMDYEFTNVFGIEFIAGRNFQKEHSTDQDALILNETAVKWMGFYDMKSAVGQQVDFWGKIYNIVGVMKNYHQQSLKAAFEPHLYMLRVGRTVRGHFAFKINAQDVPETVNLVRQKYQQFFPGNPFNYFFLDEHYNDQYKGDELFGRVFGIFSFLAILVTCLGIFGLSSFMALQRTKEVGIRKVLGASVGRIIFLLAKDFVVLLLSSFVISIPLAIIGINQWLNGFASRMSLNAWLFILPFLIVSVVTLITISSHVTRAARANPVESIRYE